ncbi:MAG: class I tRNA ligase family protein [Patescibacteria group bacterium]
MPKFYITTSIPYANSVPHIGNVLDSVYADVLARFWRQRKYETYFLTGTDEHGAKIVRTAEAAGLMPRQLVDQNSARFQALKEALNLSWDDFIRTSDQNRHWPGAQKMWNILYEKGDLYKKIYKGSYCVGHEAFVTDKDLENGICKDHQKKPEIIEEENWFFRLSKYSEEIGSKIKSGELRIVPETRKNEILSLIKEGLEDVSFSRPQKDLPWGVPVPNDPTQTIYVWGEALVNYISALGYGSEDETLFKKFWPADVQVIGKDNLRFHAAIWSGMLLAAGIALPKAIFVHGFLNVGGQKISKTIGNVIDPFELIKKYGTEAVRYYLLREVPPFDDGDFSDEKFKERHNGDLANGLGNFTARVLALAEKSGEMKVGDLKNVDPAIIGKIESVKKAVELKVGEFKFHEALSSIWDLIAFGDKYVNEKKPWEAIGGNQEVLYNLIVILDNIAVLSEPFLPETSKKITESISWPSSNIIIAKKIETLFPRL